MGTESLVKILIEKAAWLAQLILDLATGKKSEDEARAECRAQGVRITETDTDAELEEYERLAGEGG